MTINFGISLFFPYLHFGTLNILNDYPHVVRLYVLDLKSVL